MQQFATPENDTAYKYHKQRAKRPNQMEIDTVALVMFSRMLRKHGIQDSTVYMPGTYPGYDNVVFSVPARYFDYAVQSFKPLFNCTVIKHENNLQTLQPQNKW